ncbi:DEKNAAC102688 [Brettanomyces naardenensis]|uniref:Mannan endo-1,6-alpha-mannosidase n=1 Tax=Brettanomyces naardenensis TaxID=13370 RepID=A0A448YK77_BRENA|nr:DEKNAAC102688 [Brettanomyces naardenensis]
MRHLTGWISSLLALLSLSGFADAVELDVTSYDSIKAACELLAVGLMDYYWGDQNGGTVGMFTHPYYWWEAGGAWGSMIDYSFFFDNDTYVPTIIEGMLYQTGDDNNYMPLNQTTTEGNDDQVFWGIAAIEAAERNFTNPPSNKPQWLYLAQGVFNTMAWRWDNSTCGGGLRWQIFQWNSGYDYKNTVSNAGLFHMSARLARYTGNTSYVDWASKVYDWLVETKFVTEGETTEGYYFAYDGASTDQNCTEVKPYQWTYNAAMLLSGCAYLYNFTEDQTWLTRTEGLLLGATVFFNSSTNIMYEAACQQAGTCNNDQRSFKAYLARFMGLTSVLAPSTYDTINELLTASAKAAALSCSGGTDGHTCGMDWFVEGWDGKYGLGEQMSALECIQSLLVTKRPAPYTNKTGGSSTGSGDAGMGTTEVKDKPLDLNTGDTVGAAIITAFIGATVLALGYFVLK